MQKLVELNKKRRIKKLWFFISLNFLCFVGSKAQAANQLYTENRILKELGMAAVETTERMDEEIELKDNKINVLEKELKDVNHYDEQKIQTLLNKKTCN